MAIEGIRGCGYRKVGGLYLVADRESVWYHCDRIPFVLTVCPVCGEGIKQTKGFRWVEPVKLLGGDHKDCKDDTRCSFCHPELMGGNAGMLWVGEKFYGKADDFLLESQSMGVSKRLNAIPKDFKLGKTWVLLAHKEGGTKSELVQPTGIQTQPMIKTVPCPAIFGAFIPQRLEMLIWKSEATPEKVQELEARGITPVIVPDGDQDHDPKRRITSDVRLHKQMLKEKEKSKQQTLGDLGVA